MMNTVPLGEVADLAMGSAPPGHSYNNNGQGLPMIAGAGDYGEKFPNPKKWTTSPTRVTEIGDLIVCVRATIGDLNWADKKYCLGRGVAGLRPKKGELDINFAAHYINAKKNDLEKLGTGSTFLAIRRADLENFPIPLPPLPEQKRIAAILDKADTIRRKRQQAIKLADEFLRATFLDMFGDPVTNSKGWKQRKFSDVCIINPKPEKNVKFDRSSFVSFVPMACVDEKRGQIMNSEKKTYAEVAKGYTFFKNRDVLMAKITPCMENGKAAIAENLINGLGFGSTEFHVLRPESEVTSEYIFSFIHREPFRLEAKSRFTGTAGQQRVPTSFLKDYEIPVPSIDLQNKFSTFFKKIRKIRQKSELLIDKNADLFSSLTQKAFRGEL